ncbi:MAG: hypothetical protein ABEK84_00750 [Salinibacter sp.]
MVLAALVGGCGGGGTYTINRGQVAQRFLPSERTVHHPDSLKALTITEEDGKIQYVLERDYQALVEKWSASFQNVGAGPSIESRTYATLWSLELALVSLQPEMGILSLRKERARKLIEKRRERYFDRIRIDVYWFVGPGMNGIITGPGARTELVVGDRTLRPVRSDHGPLREAYVAAGGTALYRRNTLYFPRTVEGTDVLKNASGVRLTVRRTGAASKEEFSWQWQEPDS